MDIRKENIELIIFEYLEGNLSQDEIRSLFSFLEKNPSYKKMLESFSNTKLEPDKNLHFDKKYTLKKSEEDIYFEPFELLCIKHIEGSLDENETKDLKEQISKSPEKKKIFETYQKTILKSEQSEKFENKGLLKKNYSNFEQKCIEYLEGEVSQHEVNEFLFEISSNHDKKRIFELYQKTKLKPDNTIIYGNKAKLKKTNHTNIYSLRWVLSAAASVILIIYIAFSISNSNKQLNSCQIAYTNQLNPLNNRTIQNNQVIIKQNNPKPIKNKIHSSITQKTEPMSQTNLAQENTEKKDSIRNIENTFNANDNIQYTQKNISIENDSITNEVLEKLFAQNKFNYFHQMIAEVSNEKQAYLPNHKGSWWNILENGSNFISERTGTKVAVKEYKYEDNQRVKQEFTLGNFTFSRSVSKK